VNHQQPVGPWQPAAVVLTAALLPLAVATALAAQRPAGDGPTAAPSPTAHVRLSAGYDVYRHTYHLATDDTTETIGEFNATAAFEARSPRLARHQWQARAEASAGDQLWRELVDLGYRWRPGGGEPRLRADLAWNGRQYRRGSDYALSSDHHETRGELRAYPWRTRHLALDLRLRARRLDYRRRSVLEQDQRETAAAVYLASRPSLHGTWRLGLVAAARAYPDSSAIDRRVRVVEGEWERSGARGDAWLFHRSERRTIADELVRPSAWLHWSELRLAARAGRGRVVANLGSEVWLYDRQTTVWFDAWRTDLELGYRWGDLLGSQQQALVTLQNLAAGDSPEAYSQLGVRGSLEGFASRLGGIVAVEVGRRWYRNRPAGTTDDGFGIDAAGNLVLAYSDFTYLELWLMAAWEVSTRVSLEITVSYQPELHTERDDDTVLGFGSVRAVWRP
jgi:hypothetical protein